MPTMNLKIDDDFFPHFKAMIDSFIKDKKVEVIDTVKNDYPSSLTINSIEEVQKRVLDAERRINDGNYITQEQYEEKMDDFFQKEFGVNR
ncbi:hypothetical protein CP965_03400 [Halarcobacter mediterraneus]|uniref:Uncharacterized protein n=1 Tax=Halarcobacter mediterraneus TaxID=2023153 RepID=A0A4Q1B7D5_9BACT|nr:hypothetical protein [Halarcobacter mediterraneus]RXK14509.1 hypothetical protein CP965_03400 [Halarcobacter mediterraneus]